MTYMKPSIGAGAAGRARGFNQRGLNLRGFTLIEILIVVIILGILAAICLPQFSSASAQTRKNSLLSQLQSVRSQISLYALEHRDQFPPALVTGGATPWGDMLTKTAADHTTTNGTLGPYLMSPPVNHLNGSSAVTVVTGSVDYGSGGVAAPDANSGWVFNASSGKIWATSALKGYIYNERNATDPNNDQ